jgi:hypothetical protein
MREGEGAGAEREGGRGGRECFGGSFFRSSFLGLRPAACWVSSPVCVVRFRGRVAAYPSTM